MSVVHLYNVGSIFALRLRNLKNKLNNATEVFGLSKRTPMGIFLTELGIEPEFKAN